MRDEKPGADALEALIAEVRGMFAENDPALMQRFADAQLDRAGRLDVDRSRLFASLGADHPRVAALDSKIVRLRGLGADLTIAAEEQACVSKLADREWAVIGRITDSDGNPLAGMRVQLVAPEGKWSQALKPAKTNTRGWFRAVYHGADLGEDKQRRFAVEVDDDSGKTVFRSPEPIEPLEGSFTSLSIALSRGALENGAPSQRCVAATSKGTQCRNMAVSGSTFCGTHGSDQARGT